VNHYYPELPDGPQRTVDRDILLVFNSWSATSVYHVIIETIFPLWVTLQKAIREFNHTTDKITLLNLTPTCRDEPHLYTVKPVIEKVFGAGTYETSWGIYSNSFSYENVGYYKNMIYGFNYPLRPYRNHVLTYNIELGRLFREFADTIKDKYVGNNTYCEAKEKEIGLIYRMDYDSKRNFNSNLTLLENLFYEQHQMRLVSHTFGKNNLSTFEAQASAACSMKIMLGAEGAGFIQQLYMPRNSLLILLHTPRLRDVYGKIEGSQWHEAVAQYLDNSVVNMITKGTDILSEVDYQRIVNVTMMAIEMHQRAAAQHKFFSCNVKPIDQAWEIKDGCESYQERAFLA
jgi:hypothetical protein